MDLAIVVYLIGLFSSITDIVGFILVASAFAVGGAVLLLPMILDSKSNWELIKKYSLKLIKYLIIPAALLLVIIPSKTDMYIMTGLVVGEKILTSEKGNELLDKSYLYIIDKIDTAIIENTETEEAEQDAK